MSWETRPVTPDRFEDFADVINSTRRVNHCWCLSHRLQDAEIEQLGDGNREQAMRRLCERDHPPGVVTYRDGEPVGWCNIGPRTEITRLARSRLIRPVDELPVWSIVCVIVRPGHRRQGVTAPLIEGAVAYAASHCAPAVEAYPEAAVTKVSTPCTAGSPVERSSRARTWWPSRTNWLAR